MDPTHSKPTGFRGIVVAAALTTTLCSLGIGCTLVDQHRATWSAAALRSKLVAATLSHEIGAEIAAHDLSLQAASRIVGAPTFATMGPEARQDALAKSAIPDGDGAMSFLDVSGQAVSAAPAHPSDPIDWSDLDWSKVQRFPTADGLFLSQPSLFPRGQDWLFTLSRRVSNEDGRFAGVIVQPIRKAFFDRLAAALPSTPGMTVHVLSADGAVFYEHGLGQAAAALGPAITAEPARLPVGQIQPPKGTLGRGDGDAVSTEARVAGTPLVVSVSVTGAALFAAWLPGAASTAMATLGLIVMACFLLRTVRRQQAQLSLAEQRAEDLSVKCRDEVERLHTGKTEAVGRVTAGVAHDFNNYLQTITSSLEIISADYLTEPDAEEIAQLAYKAANKGAKLTQRLLTSSGQQMLRPCRIDVGFLLSDMGKLISDARVFETPLDCRITVEPRTNDLHVDPVQVESCLLNLLLNARDAMPQGGTLYLRARNARPEDSLFGSLVPDGRHVILTVRDSGRGMDEATRSRAFEPFFTTKPFGNGAGLGLATAKGFCHQSGGDIRILSNRPQPGTTVELWLPGADTALVDETERDPGVSRRHDILMGLCRSRTSAQSP